ncbi:MAG: hypothetical protein GXP43_01855 [bacterium]|nr:hypothetical protein [bacterium]
MANPGNPEGNNSGDEQSKGEWETRPGVDGQFPGDLVGQSPGDNLPVAKSVKQWEEEEKALMAKLDAMRESENRPEGTTHVFKKDFKFYRNLPRESAQGSDDVLHTALEPIYVKKRGNGWQVLNPNGVKIRKLGYGRTETIPQGYIIYGWDQYQPQKIN